MASRRRRRAPRVSPAAVRRRYAPHVLGFAGEVEAEIAAEFARQSTLVLRELEPILMRMGLRRDAVSLPELFRMLSDRTRPEATLRRLFGQVDRETLHSLERRLPQLPIAAVVSNAQAQAEAWTRRNADLIRVAPRVQRAVQEVLAQPLERGLRVEEIKARLQEQFGFEERRAQLIARDQTLKLAGQLQEARQTQAGITRYVWTTSDDERVRPDHAELDGTVQEWASPPIVDKRTGRRGHPGDDFQCRCTADPVLEPDAEDEPERPVPELRETQAAPEVFSVRTLEAPAPVEPEATAWSSTSTSALFEQAESFEAAARAQRTAPVEAQAAIDRAAVGKSLEQLGAIPFTPEDLGSDAALAFLRADPVFRASGNVSDNFGSSPAGLPQLAVEADGNVHLRNGRHRLTVARELGLRQIVARVIRYGARGGKLWEYVGYVRV